MKKITCFVTGAGGGVGQGIIKSLLRIADLDVEIIAADMSPLASGLYFVNKRVIVPGASDPNYIDKMIDIFREYGVDYYFPGTDVELKICQENHLRIETEVGTKTLVVKGEAVSVGDDKFRTAEFLRQNGFSHPRTYLLEGEDLPPELDFPVIIKPRIGCRSIGVSVARTKEDVRARLLEGGDLLLQEYAGADNTEHTCTVVVHNGEVLGSLILRRDLRAGDTYRAKPIFNTFIEKYIHSVALALDVDGSVNFQLRLDEDGVPKIFEINPRFSGTTPFCSMLGFNPVEAYLKAQLGIRYQYTITYDHMILRNWEEALVPMKAMEEVSL